MKLNTQKETEIIEAYKSFWVANLSANMEIFGSYLVDDFSIIGSAKGETFFSRKDAIAFYAATAEELKDKAELRNREIRIQPVEEHNVIVHELCDLYVLLETEWTFYGHARISCVMKKIDGEWKALHQHASFPDHRTEEGQQLAAEKIEKENLELKEAVQRRTVELEYKNRELEIEAALERIRAVAMGMGSTNDLIEIAKVQFTELMQLGFEDVRNSLIGIFHDGKDYFTDYDYSDICGGNITDIPINGNVIIEGAIKRMKSATDVFTEFVVEGQDMAEWKAFRQKNGEYDDPRIKNAGVLYYYFYSVNNGIVGISTFKRISSGQLDILKKFRNVFDLAYKRYLDISKAEAQAREAQIEAALERIRTQSMAMQQTTDIAKVNEEIFKQISKLNIDGFTGVAIYLVGEDEIVTVWDLSSPGSMGDLTDDVFRYDPAKTPTMGEFIPIWKAGKPDYFVMDYPKERLLVAVEELQLYYPAMAENFRNAIASGALEHQWNPAAIISHGILSLDMMKPPTDEVRVITLKMAAAFNHAHQRFYDLQKAEAQTREAHIEAALERVRSRTMGMQKSEELKEVIEVVYNQFVHLKIPLEHTGFVLDYKNRNDHHIWIADQLGTPSNVVIPYFDAVYYNQFSEAKKNGLDFFTVNLNKEEKDTFYHALFQHLPGFPEASKEFILQQPVLTISTVLLDKVSLYIDNFSGIPYTEEENVILMRLGKVFEQTYTRFLDLQKAENQTRVAQIELAVERVRAKALAMHNSAQIGDVVETLRHEMLGLEIPGVVAATIYLQEEDGDIRMWDLSSVKQMGDGFHVSLDVKFKLEETNPGLFIRRVWNNTDTYFIEKQEAHDMAITLDWLRQYYPEQADEVQEFLATTGWDYLLHPTIQLAHGKMSVDIFNRTPPDEMESIMVKMGAAFDLAYKRFLDLQKSEQQMREAQIELALERVRAKTMAMQHSDELADTSAVLFQQIKELGFQTWSCGFFIWQKDDMLEAWMGADSGGVLPPMHIPFKQELTHYDVYNASLTGATSHHKIWEGEALQQHYDFLRTIPSAKEAIDMLEASGLSMPDKQCYYVGFFEQGYLLLITKEPDNDLKDLSKRFAKVFEQTYTRFLDLQKAENQTREAQVELSLERIRAKVTAMKVSNDLLDIVVTMRTEFVALGHEAQYFWHMRWQETMYDKAMTSGDGTRIGNVMTLPRHMHGNIPVIANWENSKEPTLVYAMDVETAIDYVIQMINLGDFEQVDPNAPTLDDMRHIGGLTFIMARTTHGEIGFSLPGPVPNPPADAIVTLVRFAAVFDLAYRRFEDLKSSEKQIREAQIELALERVRARTMAMQHSNELADASFVLDTQVRALGIQTRGCAFNIYGDNESTEWFSSAAGMLPPYKTPREDFFLRAYEAGQSNVPIYIEAFVGDDCKAHYEYLQTIPVMGDTLRDMIAAGLSFPETQIDHATFFKYGYLLFITLEPVPDAHEVFIRFAKVFEQTYTRFLDLQKAEAQAVRAGQDLIEIKDARKKAEDTLVELQATQKQLIQSEKMASLGELTAGIAHEIQNPLNFVNNFSEVSNELVDEMNEELDKGDIEEAKTIAGDIKTNLEKINHHGKRADAIVKGMLQHSRKSEGQKEPTDINALCDEYLRLSYHGLRAKDKSFNATLKTDFDDSIGKINIIPQDIGRVIMNLLTNAFYAVNEKKSTTDHGLQTTDAVYEPTVSISTKKINDKIEIKITDNGNGIPQNILDKIFQPFFTTKPTGQGTGLGLSLAYDIVKAHGGALKVETKENEGTQFIINLAIS